NVSIERFTRWDVSQCESNCFRKKNPRDYKESIRMHSATKKSAIAAVLATAVVLVFVVPAGAATKKAKKIPSSGPFTLDFLTFYGFWDNSPPGVDIAHPVIHSGAGGKGTFNDPITFAVAPQVQNVMKPGTKIYVNFLKKYFIMEDDCTASGPGGP